MTVSTKSENKSSEILGNFCVFGFSLLVTLIIAEIALRVIPLPLTKRIQRRQHVQKGHTEVHPKGLYTLDEKIGWTLTPNFSGQFKKMDFNISVQANSDGIREHEVVDKQHNKVRILGLGDSFAFGWGVEYAQTFYSTVETLLNVNVSKSENLSYEVINTGIPGYGTYEALQSLQNIGMGYNPDVVVLAFYEGNDYINNGAAPRNRVITDGYLKDVTHKKWPIHAFILKHSIVCSLVDMGFGKIIKKTKFKSSIKKTKNFLTQMNDILSAKEIPFVFVLIPDQEESFYERSALLRRYDQLVGGADLFDAREELQRFAKDNNIYFYKLSDNFENAKISSSLRLKDTHFNEKGHALAGKEIFRFLKNEGVVE